MDTNNKNPHGFDLSKPKERRFDFKKDPEPKRSSVWKWIGMGTIVACLGLGGYGLYSWNNNDKTIPSDSLKNGNDQNESNVDSLKEETILSPDTLVISDGENPEIGDQSVDKSQPLTIKKEENPSRTSVLSSESMEETVISVIRGNYGNNPVRRRLLGDRYQEIQDEVNKMYREGKVY